MSTPGVDLLFESAWLKWAQAIVHSQTLQRDIEDRAASDDLDPVRAFRTEYDARRHGFALVIEDVAPIPVRWRLLMGDIANNYRASLDHLAWALVSRGSTPPGRLTARQERKVYFPIYDDRLKYNDTLSGTLPGIRRADAAKVRWAQPYRTGPHRRPRHALELLASINTGDKHRTIQPLWDATSHMRIEVTDMRDCFLHPRDRWQGKGDPVRIGAEVAFMRARKMGPKPELDVNLLLTPQPTIGNRIGLQGWGQRTGVFVFKLLRQFSDQPPSIHEIGAELLRLPH